MSDPPTQQELEAQRTAEAEKTNKGNLAKYKKAVRRDLDTVVNTADVLSGTKDFDSKRLRGSKKIKDPFQQAEDKLKTKRFLDFMEAQYKKQNLVRINLERKK